MSKPHQDHAALVLVVNGGDDTGPSAWACQPRHQHCPHGVCVKDIGANASIARRTDRTERTKSVGERQIRSSGKWRTPFCLIKGTNPPSAQAMAMDESSEACSQARSTHTFAIPSPRSLSLLTTWRIRIGACANFPERGERAIRESGRSTVGS